jgi:hypothetical protein
MTLAGLDTLRIALWDHSEGKPPVRSHRTITFGQFVEANRWHFTDKEIADHVASMIESGSCRVYGGIGNFTEIRGI